MSGTGRQDGRVGLSALAVECHVPDHDVFQSPSSAHSSDAANGEDSADKMSECSRTVSDFASRKF